jgi:hypothetical protein
MVEFEAPRRLIAHQVELVAGEVIMGHIVMAPAPRRGSTERTLANRVPAVRKATRERIEVRDGEHHTAARAGHTRHFGNGTLGRIEVIDGAFADHRIETLRRERQSVPPCAHRMSAHGIRVLSCRAFIQHLGQRRHPRGRFRGHHERATLRECAGVLPEATRDIENPLLRAGASQSECALRHPLEQVCAVPTHSRRNHIPHVPIKIYHPHSVAG